MMYLNLAVVRPVAPLQLRALLLACLIAGAGAQVQAQQAPPAGVGTKPAGTTATPPVSAPASMVTAPQGATAAQRAAAARVGAPVTNAQIADGIARSGMSEAQIRSRLQAAGLDASMADPFFRAQGAASAVTPSAEFMVALREMGVLAPDDSSRMAVATVQPADTTKQSAIFGKSLFLRASTAFDPVTSGPVDPSYRLGVGDNLQVILTGETELAYAPVIRRDGTVTLPQIGQVALAGLSLDAARTVLKQRAAVVYSGVGTGVTTMDLSISSIRTNAVFVIGEVEEPGAYTVSALATVFHALARAGGPTERGSFRSVELRRAGKVIRTLDLYEYLLKGDAAQDIRLEQGDVIFVPLNTRAVAVEGAVRRQSVFELRDGEGFAELVRFAGGVLPQASLERVQVDRILPAADRSPRKERVLIDIKLGGTLAAGAAFPLADGDMLKVFEIGDTRRNVISLVGAVTQPGEFEWRSGVTIDSLIASAQGLLPSAIRERVLIQRLNLETGRLSAFTVDLGTSTGRAFELAEFDRVEVLDVRRQYPQLQVTVAGAVTQPDTFDFVERESLRSLIDRSGGFAEGAQVVTVSRRIVRQVFSDTTSQVFTFSAIADFSPGGAADTFIVEPFERVDVRLSPGYRPQRFARVLGAFRYPGTYAVSENVDRLLDLVRQAGGLLPLAHPPSFRLEREGELLAVDFDRALAGDLEHNVLVRPEDQLTISSNPNVVRVQGAVERPSLLVYQRGLSVSDYIERAGGPTELAQVHRSIVYFPSGFSQRSRRVLGLFRRQPDVVAGATITVPVKPEKQGATWGDALNRTLQIASTLASLAVAWSVANR
jgi:protein involved in polysaccharide export with SLBB domain